MYVGAYSLLARLHESGKGSKIDGLNPGSYYMYLQAESSNRRVLILLSLRVSPQEKPLPQEPGNALESGLTTQSIPFFFEH